MAAKNAKITKEVKKVEEVKATAVKAEPVKKVDTVKAEPAKTEPAKVEKKVEEKKPVEKKPVEKKPAEKKPAAKKPAAKKATAKKPAAKAAAPVEVFVQFNGQETVVDAVVAKAKAAYEADGHRASSIKELQVYLKPEESAAYYVINKKYAGRVDLF
ncbi:MAG: DUF6465 family protein [Butyrivibrio sp.]|nr:DUF6465 family protein [Butyrivibrio sp.]